MQKASELHDELLQQLLDHIASGDFNTQLIFQPLPTLFAQQSVKAGGNMLGLERNKEDGILLQINVIVKTRDQEQYARPRVIAALKTLKSYARTIPNGLFD